MSEAMRIKEMPLTERPRERLATAGPDALTNIELLAILLRTGTKGASALDVAATLMSKYRFLDHLSRATLDELCVVKGVGRNKAVTLVAALAISRRLSRETRTETPILDTPAAIADLMREEVRTNAAEHFYIILLNTRRRLIRVEPISKGTLDTTVVHPREVFRAAILANASAVVLVHNHPSGDPTPSESDIRITRDLVRAGHLLRIEVLDHVVIGRLSEAREKDYSSLRELGFMT